jgi:uncharacterized protein YdaU (DUF1376 family)
MASGGRMTAKVRHVDFYPDEYVAGVGGKLSAVEQGVYWMLCSLIYSRGGPVDDDHAWLARLFAGTHWRTIRAAVDDLIAKGKVERVGDGKHPQLMVMRCADELQKALTRSSRAVENGSKGGRPTKENNEIEQPEGLRSEKLTTNYQPSTVTEASNEASDLRPKKSRKRFTYAETFEQFWREYPTDALMSKAKAASAFDQLSSEDQEAAIGSLSAFKAHCRVHVDYRPVHAVRYITERRFDGFNAVAAKTAARRFVEANTPIWRALEAHRGSKISSSDRNGVAGWWFEISEIEAATSHKPELAA